PAEVFAGRTDTRGMKQARMKEQEQEEVRAEERLHQTFVDRLKANFHLRLHMMMILTGTTSAGVIANKCMFLLGLHPMMVRYPLVAAASYAAFLGLVRVWVWLVLPRRQERQARQNESSGSSPRRAGSGDGGWFEWGGSGRSAGSAPWRTGSGSFN